MTLTQKTEDHLALAEQRAERLGRIMDRYELDPFSDAPDGSVLGASRVEYTDRYHMKAYKHPRYTLVTQYGDHGNYRVHLANDLPGVERLGAHVIGEGELISCYFDLDELAGEKELPPDVRYQGEIWDVIEEACESGEPTGLWTLRKDPADRRRTSYDWATADPSECDTEGWEDPRMPVRYGVAKVVVSVAFNTVPSP